MLKRARGNIHPKEPVSAGVNFDDRNATATSSATQNSPVSSNEHPVHPERGRRNTEHVRERNFAHDIKGKNENSTEVLVLDWESTAGPCLKQNSNKRNTTKVQEKEPQQQVEPEKLHIESVGGNVSRKGRITVAGQKNP